MHSYRTRLCFPEIDLKLSLSPVMVECLNNLPNEKSALGNGDDRSERSAATKALQQGLSIEP